LYAGVRSRMKFGALTRLENNAQRVGEIIGVLAKYGLADWVKGWNYPWIQDRIQSFDGQHIPDLKVEERVRLALTELAPPSSSWARYSAHGPM
jgi:hypothetical protein